MGVAVPELPRLVRGARMRTSAWHSDAVAAAAELLLDARDKLCRCHGCVSCIACPSLCLELGAEDSDWSAFCTAPPERGGSRPARDGVLMPELAVATRGAPVLKSHNSRGPAVAGRRRVAVFGRGASLGSWAKRMFWDALNRSSSAGPRTCLPSEGWLPPLQVEAVDEAASMCPWPLVPVG